MTTTKAGLIFDGDDTLWETMPLYTEAKHEFYDLMVHQGFDRNDAEALFEAVDASNVELLGFSQERFPQSMAETYQALCERHHTTAEKFVIQNVIQIGRSVFRRSAPTMPGAVEVLTKVREDFELVLATKGDTKIQRRRCRESALEQFFAAVYVLVSKTSCELERILRECQLDRTRTFVIGNSVRSDIVPATELGLRAIWIPYRTWSYEEVPHPTTSLVWRIESLYELPSLLSRLQQPILGRANSREPQRDGHACQESRDDGGNND